MSFTLMPNGKFTRASNDDDGNGNDSYYVDEFGNISDSITGRIIVAALPPTMVITRKFRKARRIKVARTDVTLPTEYNEDNEEIQESETAQADGEEVQVRETSDSGDEDADGSDNDASNGSDGDASSADGTRDTDETRDKVLAMNLRRIDELTSEHTLRFAPIMDANGRDDLRTMSAESDGELPARNEPKSFEMCQDPAQIVAINTRHRRADVPDGVGSDLWAIDQVNTAFPSAYIARVPTFAPLRWQHAKKVTQSEYAEAFKTGAVVLQCVRSAGPIDNVVIAGGAAAWPLGDRRTPPNDVDLFIHGLTDERALWTKVNEIVRKLSHEFMKCGDGFYRGKPRGIVSLSVFLTPGLVKLRAAFSGDDVEKVMSVDIILRAYGSVSAILHGFDIGSAAVAFDWQTTYTTTMGAYAYLYRVNLVEPAYRSLTYESRLAKYMERGYALGLCHLAPASLKPNQKLALPHCTLDVKVVRGLCAHGDIILPDGTPASDYTPSDRHASRLYDSHVFGEIRQNVRRLAMARLSMTLPPLDAQPASDAVTYDFPVQTPRFGQSAHSANWDFRPILTGYTVSSHGNRCNCWPCRRFRRRGAGTKFISFAEFAARGAPNLNAIINREQFICQIDRSIKAIADRNGKIAVENLRDIFGLTPAEIATVSEAILATRARHAANNDRRRVPLDLSGAMAPFRAKLLAKYDAIAARPIDWWIRTDPGRQYTASMNPREENPADWYGAAFTPIPPSQPSDAVIIDSLRAQLEALQTATTGKVYEDDCAFCSEPISGAANVVTLPCGHRFHWAVTRDTWCEGFSAWVGNQHTSCPTCRAPFGNNHGSEDDVRPARPRAIPVEVTW